MKQTDKSKRYLSKPKSFDELTKQEKYSGATENNSGVLNIDNNATDTEAFESALMQNTAMALTEPGLAPDGTYPIVCVPRTGDPMWKIIFSKEGSKYMFAHWVHPEVHKKFMREIERLHDSYNYFMATRKSFEEYVGVETAVPPWIAQRIELETGYAHGSEEFASVLAGDSSLRHFWINKQTLPNRKLRRK